MGYAKHVGRVGALAVALGVGVAVNTGVGLGLARADEPANTDAPSVEAAPPSGEPNVVETPSGNGTSPSNGPAPGPDPVPAAQVTAQGTVTTPPTEQGPTALEPSIVRSSGGALTSARVTGEQETKIVVADPPAVVVTDPPVVVPDPPVVPEPPVVVVSDPPVVVADPPIVEPPKHPEPNPPVTPPAAEPAAKKEETPDLTPGSTLSAFSTTLDGGPVGGDPTPNPTATRLVGGPRHAAEPQALTTAYATANGDDQTTFTAVELTTGATRTLTLPGYVRSTDSLPSGYSITDDGTRAIVFTEVDGATRASVVDLTSMQVVATAADVAGEVRQVDVNDAGTVAVIHTDQESSVTVIDVRGRSVEVATPNAEKYRTVFSPDGTRVYLVADSDRGSVQGPDTVVTTIAVSERAMAVLGTVTTSYEAEQTPTLSPDGTRLVIVTSDGIGPYWDYFTVIDTGTANAVTPTATPGLA